MGAVICGSGKAKSSGKQSAKSLRRKITKDSIYDSSDFVECSSLIQSTGKEKITRTNKCDVHSSISEKLETKEVSQSFLISFFQKLSSVLLFFYKRKGSDCTFCRRGFQTFNSTSKKTMKYITFYHDKMKEISWP